MSIADIFVPKEYKPIVRKVLADKKLCRDLNIVLSAAAPQFDAAGKNPATGKSLSAIFNDVAKVIPFAQQVLQKGSIPTFGALKVKGAIARLQDKKNGKILAKAFKEQGPELNGIVKPLLRNDKVMAAVGRILASSLIKDIKPLLENKQTKDTLGRILGDPIMEDVNSLLRNGQVMATVGRILANPVVEDIKPLLVNNQPITALGTILTDPIMEDINSLLRNDEVMATVGRIMANPIVEDLNALMGKTASKKLQPPKGPAGPSA